MSAIGAFLPTRRIFPIGEIAMIGWVRWKRKMMVVVRRRGRKDDEEEEDEEEEEEEEEEKLFILLMIEVDLVDIYIISSR